MKRLALVCLVSIAFGCSGNKKLVTGSSALPASDTTALWKLWPAGARFGIVFADGALAMMRDAAARVRSDMADAFAFDFAAGVDARLVQLLGDPAAAKRAGLDLGAGLAGFGDGRGSMIFYLPVVDRAAFRAFVGAATNEGYDVLPTGLLCQQTGSLYACAREEEEHQRLGVPAGIAPPSERGHIEVFVSPKLDWFDSLPIVNPGGLHAAFQFERGGVTFSSRLLGSPHGELRVSGPSPLADDARARNPRGVLVFRGRQTFERARSQLEKNAPSLALKIAAFLTAGLSGEIVAVASGQGGRIIAEVSDKAPLEKVLESCPTLVPGARLVEGRCRLNVPLFGAAPLAVEFWLEDARLIVGVGDHRSHLDSPSPMANKLLGESSSFAAWGRGSLATATDPTQILNLFERVGLDASTAQIIYWGLLHLSEFGLTMSGDDDALRMSMRLQTSHRNPTAVSSALAPLFARLSRGDDEARAEVLALAKKHATSPLNSDVEAGYAGLAPPAAVGALPAIAIPAFMKYIAKSKTTEARQFVKKLHDGARVYTLDNGGKIPSPSSEMTPPAGSCCQNPEGKCQPDATLWNKEPWISLQFSIDDPHYYSYQYIRTDDTQVATGEKGFTVRAVGDLDCDGEYSTFEMYGAVDATGDVKGGAALYRENELE